MRWALTSLVTLIIGVAVLTACGEGNVFSLKVGDCYNSDVPITDESFVPVANVDLVSCDDPHESEVFAVLQMPDSSWRGEDYVDDFGSQHCLQHFQSFVGIEYDFSEWYASLLVPTEESWNTLNGRKVICAVGPESGKVVESAKGTRR